MYAGEPSAQPVEIIFYFHWTVECGEPNRGHVKETRLLALAMSDIADFVRSRAQPVFAYVPGLILVAIVTAAAGTPLVLANSIPRKIAVIIGLRTET